MKESPVSQATTTTETIWPQSESCFFADSDGLLFREAPEISGTLLVTFYGRGDQTLLGYQVVASSTINFANQTKKEMRSAGMAATDFIIEGGIQPDLSVLTGEGWWVYFSLARPYLTQVKILQTLLADEIKEKRATLQYVDLRMPNRAYYK